MERGDEPLDLPLGLVDREREQAFPIFGREEWHQDSDAAHVEPAVREHLQQDRVPSRRPGDTDPPEGLTLMAVRYPTDPFTSASALTIRS